MSALELLFFTLSEDSRSAFGTANVRSCEWGQIDVATRELTVRAINSSDLPAEQDNTLTNPIIKTHART